MFKATVVGYADLPDDVNMDAFVGVGSWCDNYLVVQRDGKAIFCKPVPEKLLDYGEMIEGLVERVFYLGAVYGIQVEQGYMGGRSLEVLDAEKHTVGM